MKQAATLLLLLLLWSTGAAAQCGTMVLNPRTRQLDCVRNATLLSPNTNGVGPECKATGTGSVFDASWYSGQNDNDPQATSSSGFGHMYNASSGSNTFTFQWANATSTDAALVGVAFKSPAAAGGNHNRLPLQGVGEESRLHHVGRDRAVLVRQHQEEKQR